MYSPFDTLAYIARPCTCTLYTRCIRIVWSTIEHVLSLNIFRASSTFLTNSTTILRKEESEARHPYQEHINTQNHGMDVISPVFCHIQKESL